MLNYPFLILHLDFNVPGNVDLLLELYEERLLKLLVIILEVPIVLKEGTPVPVLHVAIVGCLLIRELIAESLRQIDVRL